MSESGSGYVVAPGGAVHEPWADVLQDVSSDCPFVVRQRKERHTRHLWLKLPADDGPRRVFVKIYRPPLKRNLGTPLLAGRAAREYRNGSLARERALSVVPVLAYGERRRFGVVVDQFVAFEHARKVRSVVELILRADDPAAARAELRPIVAENLRALHRGGCLHLAASPRNLVGVGKKEVRTWRWIDLPSAIFFRRSIHARLPALADVLQVLRSRTLLPDEAARRAFVAEYAPGDERFAARVFRCRRLGVRPSFVRRLLKVTVGWFSPRPGAPPA
ncbi:MAG: hypothetical protein ACF8XB_13240 [Planctomycetota bacterium JB042]